MLNLEKTQDKDSAVIGSICVKNLAYEKRVVIRFTLNNWTTFSDLAANWKESIGGTSDHPENDRFCFEIPLPGANWSGTVEFAVRYDVAGWTFWDNNHERNHTVIIERKNG